MIARWLGAAVGLMVLAQTAAAQNASIPEVLSRDEETNLALSAAPEALRAGAGVWVLERAGFVEARHTTNGFTCIVNRDHPLARKPTCYDAEGTATVLPAVVRFGELLMKGLPVAEITADIQRGFAEGKFIAPRRPGVAYMLSNDIRDVTPSGQVISFPAHVMFYAPNLTNADIGATPESIRKQPWLPFVAYQGPHGMMIVRPG